MSTTLYSSRAIWLSAFVGPKGVPMLQLSVDEPWVQGTVDEIHDQLCVMVAQVLKWKAHLEESNSEWEG